MRLGVIKIHLDCYVKSGMDTRHVMKGVGTVVFQLESGVSLEVVGVMYVPRLCVSFLLASTLEDEGYAIKFGDG